MAVFGKADAGLPLLTHVAQLNPENVEEIAAFCERWTGAGDLVRRHFDGQITRSTQQMASSIEQLKSSPESSPVRIQSTTDFNFGKFTSVAENTIAKSLAEPPYFSRIESIIDQEDPNLQKEQYSAKNFGHYDLRRRNFINYDLVKLLFEISNRSDELKTLTRSREYHNEVAVNRFCSLCLAAQRIMTDLCDTGNILAADVRMLNKLFRSYSSSFVLPDTVQGEEMVSPGAIGQIVIGDTYATAFPPLAELVRALFALVSDARIGRHRLQRCEECKNVFVPTKDRQLFCSHRCGDRVSARRRRNPVSD